jgi:hypothetical protein
MTHSIITPWLTSAGLGANQSSFIESCGGELSFLWKLRYLNFDVLFGHNKIDHKVAFSAEIQATSFT